LARSQNKAYRSVMKALLPKEQNMRPVKAYALQWTFSFISANW